ncbi:glycoside hydrolase family 43 protein [Paenibacillus macerans]|uniref:glycoside hydrolase family 43 protein n=1 Tax=Paenibacillus macerans TaxID=44252 RepID=UPI002E23012F|nr:glycoside hydrolase family 43 protein [Paenibacillus macerans]
MAAYRNPVIPGFYPDPSVCRAGEDYYLVTSSFEYFPGVPIFHSRDLVHWRQLGYVLNRPSQLRLDKARSSGGIYAPTIRYHQGKFYVTTTNVTGGGHLLVHSGDPAGEWSDPVWIDQPGIDPDLFFDEDGTVYFSTASGQAETGIYQSVIDLKTGKRLTEPQIIWDGSGGKHPEAPHLYKIGGTYYLMLAEGGTEYGHMVTIARGGSPSGPFAGCPGNPILSHRSKASPIQATGHADLVQAHDGSWWAVCLGIRPVGYPNRHHLGRETFLAPVKWNEQGWPEIGEGGMIAEKVEADTLPLHPWSEQTNHRDDFTAAAPELAWNFLRNPRPGSWSLEERPGWLTLYGLQVTLDDEDAPAFLGRRQQHFACRAETLLEFPPAHEGDEAGLTVLMNHRFHYEIALTRTGGERVLIFRRRLGSLRKVEHSVPWAGERVILGVQADAENYVFTYRHPEREEERTILGRGECSMLATEVAGGFTGVFFGLYAVSGTSAPAAPARFDWFDYIPLD